MFSWTWMGVGAMARRSGILEEIWYITSRVPWWVSACLALLFYLVLGYWADMDVPRPTRAQSLGAVAVTAVTKTWAGIGQFVVPAVFLFGAAASAVRSAFDSRLLGRFRQTQQYHELNWREFERLVGELFRHKGYSVEVTGGGGTDGGVDLVLRRDGKRYLVQCKHWRNRRVGVKPVRELLGVVVAETADGGFVVTSGQFSREARDFSVGQPIELVDGSELRAIASTMDKEGRAQPAPTFPEPVRDMPLCPSCGAPMVRRVASRGLNKGNPFLGCSRYPACKAIVPLNTGKEPHRTGA